VNVVGSYTITYKAKDNAGNEAVATRTIKVVLNSTTPERKYLFQWDEGEGTNMPGWTWSEDVAYGHPGWTLDEDGPHGGGGTFKWGYGPRSFRKAHHNGVGKAEIITDDYAPSTSSGGALRIYDDDIANGYAPGWWVWYDGEPLVDKAITQSNTDRWSFYIRLEGNQGATPSAPASVFHVGTYLCTDTGLSAYGTGDGCPYEGPGNQHYYHYLHMSPGAWIHVELDRHPTHHRGKFVAGNDPAYINPALDSGGTPRPMHYMEHLNQFYMIIAYDQGQSTEFLLDDMYFYSTQNPTESSEPNQMMSP